MRVAAGVVSDSEGAEASLLFGRSSERSGAEPAAGDDEAGGREGPGDSGGRGKNKRGLGARAGRRDYSQLPRFTVVGDFPGGGYCCPVCGEPFTPLGEDVFEQLDWVVIVRVAAHCRRRYRRVCPCRVPATVMAPGPPKAIGKGLVTNAFIALLLTEPFAAGRSMNSLVTGLSRPGRGGLGGDAGRPLGRRPGRCWPPSRAPSRSPRPAPGTGTRRRRQGGSSRRARQTPPATWWLWVFLGPDTVCFVMDPTRSRAVLARHAGVDAQTGQLTAEEDGGPARLVISRLLRR